MIRRFIQAKNFTPVASRKISLLVIHTMESPEKPGTALAVANWFAGPNAPQASAHYCVDDSTIVQCVQEHDVAWAAPGANSTGIHIEHAGFAAQTPAEWRDPYSLAMLEQSSALAADIAHRYGIPLVKLSPADVRAGKSGICGHLDVSLAFGKTTHTDPGTNFPWESYIALISDAACEPFPLPDDVA